MTKKLNKRSRQKVKKRSILDWASGEPLFSAILRIFIVIGSSLLFASCASQTTFPPVTNPTETFESTQANWKTISQWHFSGLAGVVAQQQAHSAQIDWEQLDQQHYQIELSGPLGLGSSRISHLNNSFQLTLSNGQLLIASTPEELMQTAVGFSLPIDGVISWVRGLPQPNSTFEYTLTPYGTLSTLDQEGFHIEYLSYTRQSGILVPTKIKISHDSLRATLIIRQWQLTSSS